MHGNYRTNHKSVVESSKKTTVTDYNCSDHNSTAMREYSCSKTNPKNFRSINHKTKNTDRLGGYLSNHCIIHGKCHLSEEFKVLNNFGKNGQPHGHKNITSTQIIKNRG